MKKLVFPILCLVFIACTACTVVPAVKSLPDVPEGYQADYLEPTRGAGWVKVVNTLEIESGSYTFIVYTNGSVYIDFEGDGTEDEFSAEMENEGEFSWREITVRWVEGQFWVIYPEEK